MTELATALRKKFPGRDGPRRALKALGLDASLLRKVSTERARLAFDSQKGITMKPTLAEYYAVRLAAKAINPLLATDSKVEYGPIFKGLTRATLKQRKPVIMDALKKAIAGKTLAKDASVEHLAHMLDQFEHVKEPKSLDESVSPEQHNAMEAAAHGHSNLGIPKDVGKEFERADTGKTFDAEGFMKKLREHGMSDDAVKDCMDMLPGEMSLGRDEDTEQSLDEEGENVEIEVEEGEDGEIEQEEGEDKAAKDKAAKDKAAKGKGAMDVKKKVVTQDVLDATVKAAVAAERKNNLAVAEAREFVRPYVGDLPMALDSADAVYRAAIKAREIEVDDLDKMPGAALRTILKMQRPAGAQSGLGEGDAPMAHDSAASRGSSDRWGDLTNRIGSA